MLRTPSVLEKSGSILSQIGGTPLVRLERIAEDLPGIEIYCKAEYFNPGGSVKDRPAMRMILDG
jgi:cysteine synthase B